MPRYLFTLFNRRKYRSAINTDVKIEISDFEVDSAKFTLILGSKCGLLQEKPDQGEEILTFLREGLSQAQDSS